MGAPDKSNDRALLISGIWYGAELKGENAREEYIDVVRREFAHAVDAAGQPGGACLIIAGPDDEQAPAETGVPGRRRVFFSPRSVSLVPHLIARYGATPCEAPRRADAEQLFGNEDDWGLLRRDSH